MPRSRTAYPIQFYANPTETAPSAPNTVNHHKEKPKLVTIEDITTEPNIDEAVANFEMNMKTEDAYRNRREADRARRAERRASRRRLVTGASIATLALATLGATLAIPEPGPTHTSEAQMELYGEQDRQAHEEAAGIRAAEAARAQEIQQPIPTANPAIEQPITPATPR